MWKLITKFGRVEVWKTSSKYLACIQYEGWFIFTKSKQEAFEKAKFLQEKLHK
jgi:hypothetical protein